jgi:hypothetical protein
MCSDSSDLEPACSWISPLGSDIGGRGGRHRTTRGAVGTDANPVASGLAVAGRTALPGPATFVAVGEGAVWVLLEQAPCTTGGPAPAAV